MARLLILFSLFISVLAAGNNEYEPAYYSKYSENFNMTTKPDSPEFQLLLKEIGYKEKFRKAMANSNIYGFMVPPNKRYGSNGDLTIYMEVKVDNFPSYIVAFSFYENVTCPSKDVWLFTPESLGGEPLLKRNVTVTITEAAMTLKLDYENGTKCTAQIVITSKEVITVNVVCNGKKTVLKFRVSTESDYFKG